MTSPWRRSAFSLSLLLLIASCASSRLDRKLDAKSSEFISTARYTITPEERKAFQSLPPEAREPFIEDFWKRRDPTPLTPENEYKTEYFRRIEQANHLFSGGGSPGWLQDRGRIYITLGPPDHRETYPRGMTFYGVPTEIWWYGFFTITFVDERWVDDYRLDPDSAAQIAVINQTQKAWNEPRQGPAGPGSAGVLPGLDVRIDGADEEATRFTFVIPYRNIWLKSRGDVLETELETSARVVDAAGAEVWTFAQTFPIKVPKDGLNEVLKGDFTAEAVVRLGPGHYTLRVVVVNTTDKSKASLERAFEI